MTTFLFLILVCLVLFFIIQLNNSNKLIEILDLNLAKTIKEKEELAKELSSKNIIIKNILTQDEEEKLNRIQELELQNRILNMKLTKAEKIIGCNL